MSIVEKLKSTTQNTQKKNIAEKDVGVRYFLSGVYFVLCSLDSPPVTSQARQTTHTAAHTSLRETLSFLTTTCLETHL